MLSFPALAARILPPSVMVKFPVECKWELIDAVEIPDKFPASMPLFMLVILELAEVPVDPTKEIRSPGKEVLLVLLTFIVGDGVEPIMPIPLNVSGWLLKWKLKLDELDGKSNAETKNGAEFSVGFVEMPGVKLLKMALSLLPGMVLGFQLEASFMLLLGL